MSLLHLEARRIIVRERLAGRDISQMGTLVDQVSALPVTEQVWQASHQFEVHLKTLDAIHLATCQLVGGMLLATDRQLVAAARALGISVHDQST